MEAKESEKKKVLSFEAVAKEIMGKKITEEEAVDKAFSLKAEITERTKLLDQYKKLFKKTAEIGQQVLGKEGYVLLTQRANVSVTPEKLHTALVDVDMEDSFYSLLNVKIADARKILGTLIFSKIEVKGEPTISVTIGKRR